MHETLRSSVEGLLEGTEIRFVDLVVSPRGKKQLVEIFVDTARGITADELADVSRKLDDDIDRSGVFTSPYILVVSSPGLDRPVRYPWQYLRHKGRQVALRYRQADAQIEHTGEIVDVEDEQLIVRDGEGLRAVPYDRIERAIIQATL